MKMVMFFALTIFISILGLAGLSGVAGLYVYRRWRQKMYDTSHVTYALTFPKEFTADQSARLFKIMAGLTSEKKQYWSHREGIVFELLGTSNGLLHLISCPTYKADTIMGQLQGIVPGIGFKEDSSHRNPRYWTYGMEVAHHPRYIQKDGKQQEIELDPMMVPGLLTALTNLGERESVMIQAVLSPTGKDHEFRAAIRLLTDAPNEITAHYLAERVLDNYRSLQVFAYRAVKGARLQRATRRYIPHEWPLLLSPHVLAVVCGLPVGSPAIPGLSYGRNQQLLAEADLPTTGIVLGDNKYNNADRPVALSADDKRKNVHIIGAIGSGKSSLMGQMFLQDVAAGNGAMLIDPHGQLADDVMNALPASRVNDVLVFDLGSGDNPPGINFLEGDPHKVTNQLIGVMNRRYNIDQLATVPELLRNVTLTLAQNNMTLMEIRPALMAGARGDKFRAPLLKNVQDEAVRLWWKYDYPKDEKAQQQLALPLLRRLSVFETWPSLRGSLGQTKSTFSFKDIYDQNKIVIFKLGREVGSEEGELFVTLALTKAIDEMYRRPEGATPFGFYIDEFQSFARGIPIPFGQVLDDCRKFGVGFTVAHQRLQPLSPELRSAVASSARNKIWFTVSAEDATILSREVPEIKADLIQNLGKYEAVARLVVGDETMRPATITTRKMPGSRNRAHGVRINSQRQYANRPLSAIDAEMKQRQAVMYEEPKTLKLVHREEDDDDGEAGVPAFPRSPK